MPIIRPPYFSGCPEYKPGLGLDEQIVFRIEGATLREGEATQMQCVHVAADGTETLSRVTTLTYMPEAQGMLLAGVILLTLIGRKHL